MACQTTLLDGAMGTRLQAFGLPKGERSPVWNIEKPDLVRRVHAFYCEGGAEILLTNTFGAVNREEFESALSCLDQFRGSVRIAGAIGPTTALEFVPILAPVIDFFVLETFSDLEAARKAFAQIRGLRRQIVLSCAWIYEDGFRLYSGEPLHDVLQEIKYWPLLAFGSNCALGSARTADLARILLEQSPFDVWIKPNADASPEVFGSDLDALIGHVRYIGGCCGADEHHISAVRTRITAFNEMPH